MPSDSHSTDEPLTTTQAHVGSVERSRNPRLRPPPRRETRNKANTRAARNGGLVDKGCSVVAQMPLECAAPVEMRIGNGGGKGGDKEEREGGKEGQKYERSVRPLHHREKKTRPTRKQKGAATVKSRERAGGSDRRRGVCVSFSLSLSLF